jgi:hypothetical protein
MDWLDSNPTANGPILVVVAGRIMSRPLPDADADLQLG